MGNVQGNFLGGDQAYKQNLMNLFVAEYDKVDDYLDAHP